VYRCIKIERKHKRVYIVLSLLIEPDCVFVNLGHTMNGFYYWIILMDLDLKQLDWITLPISHFVWGRIELRILSPGFSMDFSICISILIIY